MITGGAYICVSVILSILTLLVRRSERTAGSCDEIFRYSSVWAYAMIFCAVAVMLLGVLLYLVLRPRLEGLQLEVTAGVLILISTCFLYGYRYIKYFKITLNDGGLAINYVFTRAFIPYASIRKIVMLQGGRGEEVFELFDAKDKQLLKLSSSLSNLHSLCAGVRSHAVKQGAVYRRRDMWGKWS
jgi:small-conductance mechanosensitive channel